MSTQSVAPSVPFSISHPQEHVRLLELPPELLAVVSAKPTHGKAEYVYNQLGGRIQLKSAPTNDSATSTRAKEEYLHLCTEDKVWAVRQVSTSNSVHIARPGNVPSLDAETANGPGLTAFAQPTSTLELLPAPFTPSDIEAAIRRLLPIQDLGDSVPSPVVSEQDLIASLPYPLHAILAVKRNLFVIAPNSFTTRNNDNNSSSSNSRSYTAIPTPQLLLAAWKCLFALKGLILDEADMVELGEHLSTIRRDEGKHGELLACTIRAIAEKFVVRPPPDGDEDGGEDPELTRLLHSLQGKLKGRETTLFVGEMLVRCGAEGGRPLEVAGLEEQWVELVPERWNGFCRTRDLGAACVVEGGVVSWRGPENGVVVGERAGGGAAAAVVPGKRNWHEKFAAQRKK